MAEEKKEQVDLRSMISDVLASSGNPGNLQNQAAAKAIASEEAEMTEEHKAAIINPGNDPFSMSPQEVKSSNNRLPKRTSAAPPAQDEKKLDLAPAASPPPADVGKKPDPTPAAAPPPPVVVPSEAASAPKKKRERPSQAKKHPEAAAVPPADVEKKPDPTPAAAPPSAGQDTASAAPADPEVGKTDLQTATASAGNAAELRETAETLRLQAETLRLQVETAHQQGLPREADAKLQALEAQIKALQALLALFSPAGTLPAEGSGDSSPPSDTDSQDKAESDTWFIWVMCGLISAIIVALYVYFRPF